MRLKKMFAAIAIGGTLGLTTPVTAQDKGAPAMDPMTAAMIKAGTPGPEHKTLETWVGDWSAKIRMFAPGAPPTEGVGSASITSVYGGRYLKEEFNGEVLGQPFQGTSFTGFDNVSKKFVGTWIDSMSTGIAIVEGVWDAASNSYKYEMTHNDPVTGKQKHSKLVVKAVDRNSHVSEFLEEQNGKWVKTMEITYTRK